MLEDIPGKKPLTQLLDRLSCQLGLSCIELED